MRMDRAAILAYAAITDDFNPLHVDAAFAATTPFGRPITHGMLSLNLTWQSLRAALGMGVALALDVRSLRPVLEGTSVTAGGTRRSDGGYEVWVRDESGAAFISGVAMPCNISRDG